MHKTEHNLNLQSTLYVKTQIVKSEEEQEQKDVNYFYFLSCRALRKNPSARERPPLVMLQKTRTAGGETYMVRGAEKQGAH